MKNSDIKIKNVELHFLPVETRVPLKFGAEVLTYVTCARVAVSVVNGCGNIATGWGETPLSVQWVWPSDLAYEERHEALKQFSEILVDVWKRDHTSGHPMEIGADFIDNILPRELNTFNANRGESEKMPWLVALVVCSAFDIAVHDAYGIVNNIHIYKTYNKKYMNKDLSSWMTPADDADVSFVGKYPEDFFVKPENKQPVWHLVGGKDPISESELVGDEPDDGYPILLEDWIQTDGLKCLKIKLRGNDGEWDYDRLVKVGEISIRNGVNWLSTDFNCQVQDVNYVNEILDKLLVEYPQIYGMILYVEQPFPYDLEEHRIDVHSVSARKPLFMDESAHDWHLVKLGRSLGWTGVALKTCKTQTGALLSMCWAKAHGMTLMVQDLTNPMLAQLPHVQLAANSGTIMGVESNAMQFYPAVSAPEAKVHPGIYQRRNGVLDLSTLGEYGFGYRIDEIDRIV
jgi:L-alanine-DL-glutamate epimerase-like enolase superfamily enzyme